MGGGGERGWFWVLMGVGMRCEMGLSFSFLSFLVWFGLVWEGGCLEFVFSPVCDFEKDSVYSRLV